MSTGKGMNHWPKFKPKSVSMIFQSRGNKPGFCKYLKSPNIKPYLRADSESQIAKALSFLAYFLPLTSYMKDFSSDRR